MNYNRFIFMAENFWSIALRIFFFCEKVFNGEIEPLAAAKKNIYNL